MQNQLLPEAEGYARTNVRRRIWRRFVRVMACIVVFCTTYALILPAITMEKIQCEKEEHVHGESCYEKVAPEAAVLALSCTYESLGVHVHTADCYDADQNILCGQADYVAHIHGASCVDASGNIVCQLPERVGHVHTEACYLVVEPETEPVHTHDESCYIAEPGELICQLTETEGHTHGEACFIQGDLLCQLEEQEAHVHGEDCYELIPVLICGLEENSAEPTEETQEPVLELICTEPVAQSHVHSESCYVVVEEGEEPLTCGLPEDENHTHSDMCYGVWTLICGKEEHTHDLRCKSNPEADVESETAWMASFANAELTGRWAQDMVAIAQTQVGYAESTRNYMVLDDNVTTKGYTRYGAWYGDPYGDWCAMFASFCLHYADVEAVPVESNCPKWIEALTDLGLYYSAEAFMPRSGDLVFFDWDEDGLSDHVGIVEKLTADEEGKNTLHTIEGNSGDRVVAHEYAMDDETILGYFALPEQPAVEETNPTEPAENVTEPAEDVTEPVMEKVFIRTLSYTGADYEVTLRFDELAEIPAGAELTVRELTGEEYQDYLQRTYEAIAAESNQVLVQFGDEDGTVEMESGNDPILSGAISFARFFDLTIMLDGQELQPKDTVEVSIRYDSSVELGDGEKTAVHFAHDGTVEVLEAEKRDTEMMTMGLSNDIQPMGTGTQNSETNRQEAETDEPEETEGETFVFYQDSFSVSGTISLDMDPIGYGQTTTLNWFCGKTTIKTLTVFAQFGDSLDGKRITIKVPTGFQIVSYSAIEGIDIQKVTEVTIDNEFKDYVLSSTLLPATEHGTIEGIADDAVLWENQAMTGYTAYGSQKEKDVRVYGGNVIYELAPGTQTVRVVVSLQINQELLSHTAEKEQMGAIQIITESGTEKHTTQILATATDIPVAKIYRASGSNGLLEYNASESSGNNDGYSDLLPISASTSNYLSSTAESGSYFEHAEFVISYPVGVFLEKDTLYCGLAGFGSKSPISGLVNGETVEINPKHLSVSWEEDDVNGGGTIKLILDNGMFYHSGGGEVIGAKFRANTDPNRGSTFYKGGDRIEGFTISKTVYNRNGMSGEPITVEFNRTLISTGNGKDIRVIPRNCTRRDITTDFQTTEYDYAIGGFDVFSALPYENNNFYFENPQGLKITALNFMGKKVRNVVVITNKEVYMVGEVPDTKKAESATQYMGSLLKLEDIGAGSDEYIKACYFTADFEQLTYSSAHEFGAFVYIGQFDDGKEGDVYLRQLNDDVTYDQVEAALKDNPSGASDPLLLKTMINAGTDDDYGGIPILGKDHTIIGWTNTGVGSADATVVNQETGASEDVYYANTKLKFSTYVESGYEFVTQDTLIDPVLVISLPEGLSLDTTSIYATSEAGTSAGTPIRLVEDGTFRETVVDGVRWKTYRFRVPQDQMLALVAEERFLGVSAGSRQRISATFEAVVDPTCVQYDLSLQDVIMWDVRNTAYEEDTLTSVTQSGKNGDAVNSHWAQTCVRTDENNFLGYGTHYGVANNGGTFVIKPLIGLNADLGIKSVSSQDEALTDSGYITYNGLNSSIVPVIPDKYADVKLTYHSTSDNDYFEGTVLYVPVPKKGVDYTRYFENVELLDPMNKEVNKTFGFTMDLTGPVTLKSDRTDSEGWDTWYALAPVATNSDSHTNVSTGQDTWEPVEQNGGEVQWLTAEQVGDRWDQVAMMKFVARGNVKPNERGTALMLLYVHDLDSDDGPALGGTYNYWRGYGKAVTETETLKGNWKYTSVVAATPAMETVQGQIFIDSDRDGLFDEGDEKKYSSQIYLAELSKVGGGMDTRSLVVNADGSFALLDNNGKPEYLPAGTYTVTIRRNNDPHFHFANTEYDSSIGKESPADAWHNNVESANDLVGTWTFEVTNTSTEGEVIHRVGIAVKPAVRLAIQGIKKLEGATLASGTFNFLLEPLDGAPVNATSDRNVSNGSFSFGNILYEHPGTYKYQVREDYSNPRPAVLYDYHVTTVTVTVMEDENGILTAAAVYDNSTSESETDRAITDKAAFTNAMGYELPKTGGTGTYLYTMGGMLLLAAAVLLYIHILKRRKEEQPSF